MIIRWENTGRKRNQGVIQLLQRQHKESPRVYNYDNLPLPFESSSKSFKSTPHFYVQ